MKGFLSEAGLVSGGATQISSSKPLAATANKTTAQVPQPSKPATQPKVQCKECK